MFPLTPVEGRVLQLGGGGPLICVQTFTPTNGGPRHQLLFNERRFCRILPCLFLLGWLLLYDSITHDGNWWNVKQTYFHKSWVAFFFFFESFKSRSEEFIQSAVKGVAQVTGPRGMEGAQATSAYISLPWSAFASCLEPSPSCPPHHLPLTSPGLLRWALLWACPHSAHRAHLPPLLSKGFIDSSRMPPISTIVTKP